MPPPTIRSPLQFQALTLPPLTYVSPNLAEQLASGLPHVALIFGQRPSMMMSFVSTIGEPCVATIN